MRGTLLFLMIFVSATLYGATAAEREVTKTSQHRFKVAKEVVAFVQQLIKNDVELGAQYEKLISPTREEAGGKFSTGDFEAIEWLVPEFSVDYPQGPGTEDGEFIYLVRQQLQQGYRRGYSRPTNVLAQVRVKLHEDHAFNPKTKKHNFSRATLTLTFEGFRAAGLDPL